VVRRKRKGKRGIEIRIRRGVRKKIKKQKVQKNRIQIQSRSKYLEIVTK
jgi:hypothetical protein